MIDVLVTGQSLPALQTALDLAEVGLSVVVLGPSPNQAVSAWAERDPEGAVSGFIKRIAEPIEHAEKSELPTREADAAVIMAAPTPPLLRKQGGWLPQSAPETLGVPAVPLAAENIALLGAGGAFRAYLDRITPLLTVGKTRLLGELVRKRMGTKVRERLVDPQVFARFGVPAVDVDVAIAAPGLNEALSRSGALSSAVLAYADRHVARETTVAPSGGAESFHQSVVRRLELYGVQMLESRLTSIESQEEGWVAQLSDGSALSSHTLVVDFGADPVPDPATASLVCGIVPREARIHAVIDMGAPERLESGATAMTLTGGWSVEMEPTAHSGSPLGSGAQAPASEQETGHGQWIVRLRSGVGEVEALSTALTQMERSGQIPLVTEEPSLDWIGESPIRDARLLSAPFRTVAGRAEAVAALANLELATPELLPVGRAIHGDDQGAALLAAHKSAVHLRRRLLGLED